MPGDPRWPGCRRLGQAGRAGPSPARLPALLRRRAARRECTPVAPRRAHRPGGQAGQAPDLAELRLDSIPGGEVPAAVGAEPGTVIDDGSRNGRYPGSACHCSPCSWPRTTSRCSSSMPRSSCRETAGGCSETPTSSRSRRCPKRPCTLSTCWRPAMSGRALGGLWRTTLLTPGLTVLVSSQAQVPGSTAAGPRRRRQAASDSRQTTTHTRDRHPDLAAPQPPAMIEELGDINGGRLSAFGPAGGAGLGERSLPCSRVPPPRREVGDRGDEPRCHRRAPAHLALVADDGAAGTPAHSRWRAASRSRTWRRRGCSRTSTSPRCRARFPFELPRPGGGETGPPSRGGRGGAGPRGEKPDRGGVCAVRPVRAPPAPDGRMGPPTWMARGDR